MQEMLTLTTRMNALARITLGNVNIAATTALQVGRDGGGGGPRRVLPASAPAGHPQHAWMCQHQRRIALATLLQAIDAVGREVALRRGANVLMPILTPTKYREHYTLYEGEAAGVGQQPQRRGYRTRGAHCLALLPRRPWSASVPGPLTACGGIPLPPRRPPVAGKPCITDTADECQKCLNARLSMVDKKLRAGVWGDPPSFREAVQPVAMAAAAAPPTGGSSSSSMAGAQGLRTWAPSGAAGAGVHRGRSLHTAAHAAAAADAGAALGGGLGPAAGSDVPRTNIGIFGCMNAGKSSLLNRLTRR
jgi:hypothetical protein